jgi:hypothetical protein
MRIFHAKTSPGTSLLKALATFAMVPVRALYWNDLGDPRRVYETLLVCGQDDAPNRSDQK